MRWLARTLVPVLLLAGCSAPSQAPPAPAEAPEDALLFHSCYELAVTGSVPVATAAPYVPEGFVLVEGTPGFAAWSLWIYSCRNVTTLDGPAALPAEGLAFLLVTPPQDLAAAGEATYGLPLFWASTLAQTRAVYGRWGLSPLEATEGGVGFMDVEGVSFGGAGVRGTSFEVFVRLDFNEVPRPSPAGLLRLFVPDGPLASDASILGWVDVAIAERTSIGDTVNTVEFTGFEGAAGAILPPRTPATGEIWRNEADVFPFRMSYAAVP